MLGAGVSGLSCAVRLVEAGARVRVWTREMPAQTVSAVAAALWFPYAAGPRARVLAWARVTYRELLRLAARGDAHVELTEGRVVFCGQDQDPSWRSLVPDLRALAPDELPAPFTSGFALRAPVCVMPAYLGGLVARLAQHDVCLEARAVTDLDEALATCPTVVHCTGLGARELAHDDLVHAARGQVVRAPRGEVTRFWIADDAPGGMTYVIPRLGSGDCILGGTYEVGRQDRDVDPREAEAIRARAALVEPEVAHTTPLAHVVGLRPARATVRLEVETRGRGRIVHNYGHGGSGVTLAWGCADEVVALALG